MICTIWTLFGDANTKLNNETIISSHSHYKIKKTSKRGLEVPELKEEDMPVI